ncbi:MAG TPA: hypothetical protein VJ203_10090 [Bacteroidales bacterium]|nr:hypothetical protein [Bacteroidales bacterium]
MPQGNEKKEDGRKYDEQTVTQESNVLEKPIEKVSVMPVDPQMNFRFRINDYYRNKDQKHKKIRNYKEGIIFKYLEKHTMGLWPQK